MKLVFLPTHISIADLFGAKYNPTFTEKLRLVLIMSNWVYADT